MIHTIGTVALWAGVAAGLLFCLAYHLSARWWASAEGRHLMSFTAALTLIIGWLAYRSITAARSLSTADQYTRTGVYVIVAALLTWRLVLLWRRQIHPSLANPRKREKA